MEEITTVQDLTQKLEKAKKLAKTRFNEILKLIDSLEIYKLRDYIDCTTYGESTAPKNRYAIESNKKSTSHFMIVHLQVDVSFQFKKKDNQYLVQQLKLKSENHVDPLLYVEIDYDDGYEIKIHQFRKYDEWNKPFRDYLENLSSLVSELKNQIEIKKLKEEINKYT